MDDKTRISNLKAFLLKQPYLKPFKYDVTLIDDVPVIVFGTCSDIAKGKLSNTLHNADLDHIRIVVMKRVEEVKKETNVGKNFVAGYNAQHGPKPKKKRRK